MSVLDHAKETLGLGDAVNGPGGIEDVMPAMLRVDLREHEEFDVVLHESSSVSQLRLLGHRRGNAHRRSAERLVLLDEVFHVGLIQAQANLLVVVLEGGKGTAAVCEDVDDDEGSAGAFSEDVGGVGDSFGQGLGHSVVEDVLEGAEIAVEGVLELNGDDVAALDAGMDATDLGDAGGLGAPWRRVGSRGDEELYGVGGAGLGRLSVEGGGLDQLLDVVDAFVQVNIVEPLAAYTGDLGGALGIDAIGEFLGGRVGETRLANEGLEAHGEGWMGSRSLGGYQGGMRASPRAGL